MISRDFKGVWISKEIWLNNNISLTEKCFLAEIDSLDNQDGCFASNAHFAEFSGLSSNRCSEIITSLIIKKLISSQIVRNVDGSIKNRILRVIEQPKCTRKTEEGYSENRLEGTRKTEEGYSEKAEGTNTRKSNTKSINNTESSASANLPISTHLQPIVKKWLTYKKERGQSYKPTGLKTLLSQIEKHEGFGCNIETAIDYTICNNYQGIIFDKGYSTKPNTSISQKLQKCNEGDFSQETADKIWHGCSK